MKNNCLVYVPDVAGDTQVLPKKLLVAYLKFTFNWVSCISPGNLPGFLCHPTLLECHGVAQPQIAALIDSALPFRSLVNLAQDRPFTRW